MRMYSNLYSLHSYKSAIFYLELINISQFIFIIASFKSIFVTSLKGSIYLWKITLFQLENTDR